MRALIHPGLTQVICGSSQSQASTVETSNAGIRSTDAHDRHERQIEIWFDEGDRGWEKSVIDQDESRE